MADVKPKCLLVITNDPAIAAWAAGPFRSGHLTLTPWVLGPADVPAITDLEEARQSLDMTLFSGIVHSREMIAVRIGLVLRQALDEAPDDVGLYLLLGRVEDILILLEARGLTPSAKRRRRIAQCTDLAQLERWLRKAATAKSVDAIFAPEPSQPSGEPRGRRSPPPRSRARQLART